MVSISVAESMISLYCHYLHHHKNHDHHHYHHLHHHHHHHHFTTSVEGVEAKLSFQISLFLAVFIRSSRLLIYLAKLGRKVTLVLFFLSQLPKKKLELHGWKARLVNLRDRWKNFKSVLLVGCPLRHILVSLGCKKLIPTCTVFLWSSRFLSQVGVST